MRTTAIAAGGRPDDSAKIVAGEIVILQKLGELCIVLPATNEAQRSQPTN
ncbi:MAG: hypothetical protein ACXWKA_04065 [Xanthobacteraceae bacterium]